MAKKHRIEKANRLREIAKETGMPFEEIRAKIRKLTEYEVAISCGCCYNSLWFSSDEKAFETLKEFGHRTIKDELGRVIENVDTFYGFWRKDV